MANYELVTKDRIYTFKSREAADAACERIAEAGEWTAYVRLVVVRL